MEPQCGQRSSRESPVVLGSAMLGIVVRTKPPRRGPFYPSSLAKTRRTIKGLSAIPEQVRGPTVNMRKNRQATQEPTAEVLSNSPAWHHIALFSHFRTSHECSLGYRALTNGCVRHRSARHV